jgi:hypothetical protein
VWTDTLREPGATLTGYLPAEDRHLEVEYDGWNGDGDADLLWDHVDHVDVRGPGGAAYRLKLAPSARLRLPGISCGDHISYQYVGDRAYRERTVSVDGGTVRLSAPTSDVDNLSFGLGVGGGAYALWQDPIIVRFYALVHGSLILHFMGIPGSWWDRTFRPWFEFRPGLMVGDQGYLGVGISGREESLYLRFTGEFVVLFPLTAEWYGGGEVGGMYGRSYYTDQHSLFPDNPTVIAGAILGYRPNHGFVGLEGNLTRVFSENVQAYGTDFKGDVISKTLSTGRWMFDLRLRIGW